MRLQACWKLKANFMQRMAWKILFFIQFFKFYLESLLCFPQKALWNHIKQNYMQLYTISSMWFFRTEIFFSWVTIKANVFHTLHIFLRGGIKDFFDKTSKDFKGMLRMCIFNVGKKSQGKPLLVLISIKYV